MDTLDQINEIRAYHRFLCKCTSKQIDLDEAAIIWVKKYARKWRLKQQRALRS